MSRVEDWIVDFYVKHTVRCPREDWPAPDTEEEGTTLDAWRHAFVTRGVEHRFADLASLDMAADPPRFLSDHLPAIVRGAIELRLRDDAGLEAEPAADRESAERASRDCLDCSGTGIVSRYVPARAGFFGFLCRCPMSRWIGGRHGDRCPIPEQIPGLLGRRPAPAEDDASSIRSPGDLRRFMASLAASKKAEGPIYRGIPYQPQGGAPGPSQRRPGDRPELAAASSDPVVAREMARPAPKQPEPQSCHIPEDYIAF